MTEDMSVLTREAPPPRMRIDYGAHADQHALVWQGTATAARTRPLVVLLHGGFWRPAYDLAHMSPMAAALAATGCTVANVEYRRVPGDPAATAADLRLALRKLPILVAGHNGHVVLAGFSAGGHLALWLAAMHVPLQAVLALAPVASLREAQQMRLSDDAVGDFLGPDTELPRWDPESLPGAAAPVFIVHGELDDTVPLTLSRHYVARHPRTEIMVLPHTRHYALIDPESRAWPSVLAALRRAAAAS